MPNHEVAIGPAIAVLSEALHRADVDAGFGRCPAADLQTVARNLPLPAELLSFYGTCGPLGTVNVPAPLGSIALTPARDLVSYQPGYRRHSNQGHRLNERPDEWVVIADHSGDPFIADTAVPGTRVGIAVHGTGSWRPFWVAPTPADFVMLLACFTESYVVEYLNGPGGDEDDDESRPPAYHDRLAALLRDRAPAVDAVAFLKYLRQ